MKILGIDPGTLVAGYAVIEVFVPRGKGPKLVECGPIIMPGKQSLASRLLILHSTLTAIIERHHPDECAIESAFTHKNVRSAMLIGHARGVALLAASQHVIPVTEYSPREVKKSVTGSGAASKEQVQFMIRNIFELVRAPISLDASDAVAVALCHQQKMNGMAGKNGRGAKTWKEFVEKNPDRVAPQRKR